MDISVYSSEVKNWIMGIQKLRGTDSEELLSFCDRIEEIGVKTKDDALVGFAHFSRGEAYYIRNDVNNFYTYMLASIAPMERIKEWGYVAMANNFLGIMSLNRGNAPYAMDYYVKGIEICQQYSLPDLERVLQMNIGSLYLNIEEYQNALEHIEKAYAYLLKNKDQPGYISDLTVAYLGMAKAYLNLHSESSAMEYLDRIQRECMSGLSQVEKMVVYCFKARIYEYLEQPDKRDKYITKINGLLTRELQIMDVFDEFYEYLEMLLTVEKYDDFFKVYDILDVVTKKTQVKNLEKKLLTLKIRYYRNTGQFDEYKKSTVLFYELSEYMERENRIMVTNLISLRNSITELYEINKRVERENQNLHIKSETDALTGLFNRFKLNEHMNMAFERAIKNKTAFAVEILDIDYFKQFNDNYGHQAGDACIKAVADSILTMKGKSNVFCCRYGGDEFVLIYEGMSMEEVNGCASLLKNIITRKAVTHKFSKAAEIVTITQGACWGRPRAGQTAAEYLKCADALLYAVKSESRNSYRVDNFESIKL